MAEIATTLISMSIFPIDGTPSIYTLAVFIVHGHYLCTQVYTKGTPPGHTSRALIDPSRRRQARQNRLQLGQNNSLLRGIRIQLGTRHPNTHTRIAPLGIHHIALLGQPRAPARKNIVRRENRRPQDAREHKRKVGRRRARRRRRRGEVDIEPRPAGQVGFARGDERLREVGRQLGVHGLVGLRGRRPGDLGACGAAKGEAGDAFEGGLGGGADGARDEHG